MIPLELMFVFSILHSRSLLPVYIWHQYYTVSIPYLPSLSCSTYLSSLSCSTYLPSLSCSTYLPSLSCSTSPYYTVSIPYLPSLSCSTYLSSLSCSTSPYYTVSIPYLPSLEFSTSPNLHWLSALSIKRFQPFYLYRRYKYK